MSDNPIWNAIKAELDPKLLDGEKPAEPAELPRARRDAALKRPTHKANRHRTHPSVQ